MLISHHGLSWWFFCKKIARGGGDLGYKTRGRQKNGNPQKRKVKGSCER